MGRKYIYKSFLSDFPQKRNRTQKPLERRLMDFYNIRTRTPKPGVIEVYPDFKVTRSKDLMVRGKTFYAVWDDDRQLWSTDEYDVQRLVDRDLLEYRNNELANKDGLIVVKTMSDFSNGTWTQFRNYLNHISDNSHLLDENLTFVNTEVKKTDYVSKRLPYPLEAGNIDAYSELMSTLYDEEEREKLEWAIGAIVSGDSKDIQKFIVLYGEAGGGKSTFLNILQKLFQGYYTTFEAKALTSSSNSFSTEAFRTNPLVAIQHDGDLSRIEDNTKLNSIVAHEEMVMNEKYKSSYTSRANCFLFMGTNKPVKITDGKSGIIRRLIDVRTSGRKLPPKRYQTLMSLIDFELGAIANHCLELYREMGKNYYSSYRPVDMILQTDVFYNFIEENIYFFKQKDNTTLSQAYEMYKTYCDDSNVDFKLPRHKFREELKNYFKDFSEVTRIDGKQVRSFYSGFLADKFTSTSYTDVDEPPSALVLDSEKSYLDTYCVDCLAQYASIDEVPSHKWVNVDTVLGDINTRLLHYVKPQPNHIVIDFDIKDETGSKSTERNLEEASKWPPTYAEFSKSGHGIHLHYIYDGDTSRLSRVYADGIEIKVFNGDASLRRKLTKCNTIPIAHINSGLPTKGDKMIDAKTIGSEKGLRELIERNLRKEIHPATKPSIDFIYKILEDAHTSGIRYDLTTMRPTILNFAMKSSHNAEYCIDVVSRMKFSSSHEDPAQVDDKKYEEAQIAFFDVEVYSNLFLLCWKYPGEDTKPIRMINPEPWELESLFAMRLIGFNNRRYDNHILYARYIGYNNQQLFELSQKIIANSSNAMFREAYNLSYADIYDFSSKKQSLKMFEIELGLVHKELDIPWDKPVPEDQWHLVAEYCDNDVIASEAVFYDRKEDYKARQILAELSGLTVNDTTQMHTAKILFGNAARPQDKFVYTNLALQFPGYKFDNGISTYRGEETGEGGYVYTEPGIYTNVGLLDVASMHPSSILALNLFGPYTPRYKELLDARLAIKRKQYDVAKGLLGGILSKYLDDPSEAAALAYALKIHALNIVYGLTAAKFDNKFKDPRNKDNIVAKRGALFMIDLKHYLQEKGVQIIHIKTDSVKIPNITPEIIADVNAFGKSYGYEFEHESTFTKICLVNKAVYIAKDNKGEWHATGAEFAHPYVYKTLFTKEPISTFDDLPETKNVHGGALMYLDFNEKLGEEEHNYSFVGRVGRFLPIKDKKGGGHLYSFKDGKYNAVSGTKGYRWMEAEVVKSLKMEKHIDMSYYTKLVDDAVAHISEFGDAEAFID
jgi:energy-coupling factor transporter ATP-binding protein EcfA2